MKVYFSGISGTGIGPLAELAQDAGMDVCGSDLQRGAIAGEIDRRGIPVSYGPQDGKFLSEQLEGLDWFVYTSALPADHPELKLAREAGIRTSKRDEFIAEFVKIHQQKMIAVAGTHGKTTTTAMLIWCFYRLGLPVNYLVGTTLPWANGGNFQPNSEYFIYEADEYDRNFLAFHPHIAAITCVDYDHPDIYPTREDYYAAFAQFESQSENVVKNTTIDNRIVLAGELRRQDASICLAVMKQICDSSEEEIIDALNHFPGAGRRFEEITDNVYSDYGHHPEEIAATIAMAAEIKQRDGLAGVAVVYQPHQNTRQHEVRDGYRQAFLGADRVFWLPTYLVREDSNLPVLTPNDLIAGLENASIAEAAEANDTLAATLRELQQNNWLVILITAGPADNWFRRVFSH